MSTQRSNEDDQFRGDFLIRSIDEGEILSRIFSSGVVTVTGENGESVDLERRKWGSYHIPASGFIVVYGKRQTRKLAE